MEYTIVEYVWLDSKINLRSKTRVYYDTIKSIEDVQIWNYDGSSTGQANGESSEIFLHPRALFKCPFRRPNGLIVMCDTYTSDGKPAKSNNRSAAAEIFEKYADQEPWYGLEQEYFIYDPATNLPIGFNPDIEQKQYYCSVGTLNAFGRDISDQHMEACLYAGIKVSGTNLEVTAGQNEWQIGPVEGIAAADQLWISRFILEKISEQHGVVINYHPKPLKGDWNGSGCHCNFSTKNMRNPGGLEIILNSMDKLKAKHAEHMLVYGKHNRERMTGLHETSSFDNFSWGIANRKASIRIPSETAKNGYGYLEDRRVASSADPYLVTAKILETIMN